MLTVLAVLVIIVTQPNATMEQIVFSLHGGLVQTVGGSVVHARKHTQGFAGLLLLLTLGKAINIILFNTIISAQGAVLWNSITRS